MESEGVADPDKTDGDTIHCIGGWRRGGGSDIEGPSTILTTETRYPASEERGLGAFRYRVQEIDKTGQNTRALILR